MIIVALLLIPFLAGCLAFFIRTDPWRRTLLVLAALTHTVLTLSAWIWKPAAILDGWFALDDLGLFFLTVTSVLFLAASFYGMSYLRYESHGRREDFIEEGTIFSNAPEARFIGCLLFFLSTMTLVTLSQHFGVLWVAIEATTLASAPLIYFHRHHRSLEATWKYLLICSVGIAVALLGNFFLAAASFGSGEPIALVLEKIVTRGMSLNPTWLKVAFLCFLVGYGTKMGLAPMHTWLPDAHSESPSMVSALLSGALLNCALLGILRVFQVCEAAGQGVFSQNLLIGFGLFSMLVAALFLIGQADYKRMLAYSSVEHMGILALGVGIGGVSRFGALLHVMNHSFTKAMLFFAAGNILSRYRSKQSGEVAGVLKSLPLSGMMWIGGFLAITGSPPFGTFISEFLVLKGALDSGRWMVAALYLLFLSMAFVGMASVMLRMAQGNAPLLPEKNGPRERFLSVAPPLALGALVLFLGFYVPPFLRGAIEQAVVSLGSR